MLNKGNLKTGLLELIPNFLCHDDNAEFDHYEDVIVSWVTENFNYTHEQAALLRKTLPSRWMHPGAIKSIGLSKIQSELPAIIREILAEAIVAANNYVTPENLQHLVYEQFRKIDKDQSKVQTIMNAVSLGQVNDLDRLESLIRDVFADKTDFLQKKQST